MTFVQKATGLAIVGALAGTVAFAATDADGDGLVTMDELMVAYPEATLEVFTAADTNEDGVLDGDELAAAREAGMIPAEEM